MELGSECIKQELEPLYSQRKHQNRKSFNSPKIVYLRPHMISQDKIWTWDAQHDHKEEEVEEVEEEEEEEKEDQIEDDLSEC